MNKVRSIARSRFKEATDSRGAQPKRTSKAQPRLWDASYTLSPRARHASEQRRAVAGLEGPHGRRIQTEKALWRARAWGRHGVEPGGAAAPERRLVAAAAAEAAAGRIRRRRRGVAHRAPHRRPASRGAPRGRLSARRARFGGPTARRRLGTEARTSFAAAWDAESSCSDRPPLPPPSDRGQSTLRQTAPAQHRGDRRRVEQLAVSRLEEFEARETLRRAMEEERLLATCTFQPRLSARRKSARAADDLGVSERLHSEAVHRAEVRALERAAVAEAEVAACRFQPHINDSSLHFGDSRPLHERVADVERAASLRRLELRAERDRANEEAHVFQPQINVDARSAAMAKRATDRAFKTMMEAAHLSQQLSDETANAEHPPDVAARLAADAWHRSMCGQQRLEAAEAEAAAERSRAARTKISRGSERIAASAPSIGGVPFFERERRRESEARRRRAADEEERRAEEERLFQPAISGRSAKLDERATRRRLLEAAAAADAAAAGGAGAAGPAAAPESRVARLAADAAAKEEKRAQRESEYYSQWNYKPETNARKADAAAKADYDELSRNARGSAARSRAEKEAFERQQSQCTFKPQLISKPSDKSNVKTEAERRAVKEIKIEAERKQRELDELRECSFRPSTNSKSTLREAAPAASTGAATTVKPVVVRGLARHLELRNRAKQLAQDHRSREHAAFTVERAEEWRHGQKFTTPQPFALSTGVL